MSRANAFHFPFMHHIIASFCIHVIKYSLNNRNVLNIGHSGNREKSSKIPRQHNTRSRAKKMAEKDETRFELLERSHQETREQISEMMEMIRALVREKGQVVALNPQSGAAQPEQRKEDPIYP